MPKANNDIKKIAMKKVANNKKREILSFEEKIINDLKSKRVLGGGPPLRPGADAANNTLHP